jgi:hypothetical protein
MVSSIVSSLMHREIKKGLGLAGENREMVKEEGKIK